MNPKPKKPMKVIEFIEDEGAEPVLSETDRPGANLDHTETEDDEKETDRVEDSRD